MEGVFSALVASVSDTDRDRCYNDTLAQIDGVFMFYFTFYPFIFSLLMKGGSMVCEAWAGIG